MLRHLLLLATSVIILAASEINWQPDYSSAEKAAEKTGKKLFVFISTEDCTWCRKFEATTLSDPEIVARLEKEYVSLHVTRDHDSYPEKLKAVVVPMCYFLTANSEIIDYTRGYWNAYDFNLILNDVNKRHKKMKEQE